MKKAMMFCLLLLAGFCIAQPSIEWQKSLGGSVDDYAYSIQQTSDGGFIVAGRSASNDGDVSGKVSSRRTTPTTDFLASVSRKTRMEITSFCPTAELNLKREE